MECRLIYGEKGNLLLYFGGHKFYKAHTSQAGTIRWRCVKKSCAAVVYSYVQCETQVFTKNEVVHNHGQDSTISRQIISNSVKRKAVSQLGEKPSKIICLEIKQNPADSDVLTSEDLQRISKNLYEARRNTLPCVPQNRQEVIRAVKEMQLETNKMEQFLLSACEFDQIIIFSTYTNLHFLCSVDVIYMDGTFNYSARHFTQMFTIHGYKNGYYVPLVFSLLPDKKTETYVKLFKKVTKKCEELDLVLKPSQIVIDFEQAIHSSCSQVWNGAKILGCRFHLCQSWFRKIQELGLCKEYKSSNSAIGSYLRVLFGVQFLDPEEVEDFFNNELFYLMPDDSRVRNLISYLRTTYVSPASLFPPVIWACKSEDLYRTTNCCESFHSRFNTNFCSTHPHIVKFTAILLDIQIETYTKINSAKRGVLKQMRKQTVERRSYITKAIENYNLSKVTRYFYVKCISRNYLPH